MTIRSFEAEIDAFLETDIPREVAYMQRVLAVAALSSLVLKTPVRTGRARGAWLTSVNFSNFAAPHDTGSAGAVAALSISRGTEVIQLAPPFSQIIIQNNVEYIEDLEDGSSMQAPNGMLSTTVAELERMFR